MPSLGYKGAGRMFNFIGEVAQALTFAVLWRQVLLLVGAGVYGAVCWAAFKSKQAKPSIRMIAVLGAPGGVFGAGRLCFFWGALKWIF